MRVLSVSNLVHLCFTRMHHMRCCDRNTYMQQPQVATSGFALQMFCTDASVPQSGIQ